MAAALPDLPAWAGALLAEARVAHLGLLDDAGTPRVLPVTFAVAAGAAWTAIDEVKPKRVPGEALARVRWARRRPRAALTVDRYDDDWATLAWVQLLGRVAVLDAEAGAPGVRALMERYAPYRDAPPSGPVLRLEVERGLWWRAAG